MTDVCGNCHQQIIPGQNTTSLLGEEYHSDCLYCSHCTANLWNRPFIKKNDGTLFCGDSDCSVMATTTTTNNQFKLPPIGVDNNNNDQQQVQQMSGRIPSNQSNKSSFNILQHVPHVSEEGPQVSTGYQQHQQPQQYQQYQQHQQNQRSQRNPNQLSQLQQAYPLQNAYEQPGPIKKVTNQNKSSFNILEHIPHNRDTGNYQLQNSYPRKQQQSSFNILTHQTHGDTSDQFLLNTNLNRPNINQRENSFDIISHKVLGARNNSEDSGQTLSSRTTESSFNEHNNLMTIQQPKRSTRRNNYAQNTKLEEPFIYNKKNQHLPIIGTGEMDQIQPENEDLSNRCDNCMQSLVGQERHIFNGKAFHKHCYTCDRCDAELFRMKKVHTDPTQQGMFCEPCYNEQFGPKCHKCQQAVTPYMLSAVHEGKIFHKECFVCPRCKRSFAKEKMFKNGNLVICQNCF